MYSLLKEMFPYNRSITGDGVRNTLDRISKEIALTNHSLKSGEKVFDWTVPNEWNVKAAQIINPDGSVLVDFLDNNLFLMSYSTPINQTMTLEDLKCHIISDESRPDSIPYSTSYYNEEWAFCLPYNLVTKMLPGDYRVIIDSELKKGELIYGEANINNGAKKTILISSYICHPSMANDSLSGVVLAVQLYKEIKKLKNLRFNYKFLFVPETIGTICFLYNNKHNIKEQIEYGLVATCLGDAGKFNYKKTRNQESEINRVVEHLFKEKNLSDRIRDFSPLGSDERQYCSPGFDLPVGVLTRSMYSEFPEYHSSSDNLDFVKEEYLQESLLMYLEIIEAYESNLKFIRAEPHCEPQMGKYNLYREKGGAGKDSIDNLSQKRMWILNYADGEHDLIEISKKSGFPISELRFASMALLEHSLIGIVH